MKVKPFGTDLDYEIEWTLGDNETIASSDWTVAPEETGGLAVVPDQDLISAARTNAMLTGGVFGNLYEVTNSIVTSFGRRDARTITFILGITEAEQ